MQIDINKVLENALNIYHYGSFVYGTFVEGVSDYDYIVILPDRYAEIDKEQYVSEVAETSSIVTTKISPEQTYNFENPSGKGIKVLKIVSDVPITMSYTSQQNTYNFGAKFKEIQLITNGENADANADWIAQYGSVTITNTSTTDVANVKIIFTY